ncbi:MAG: hypothetical protein PWQ70_2205 [Clostridiales bacterium]|nr:hypothetical protein [Clostridiales bacterium]
MQLTNSDKIILQMALRNYKRNILQLIQTQQKIGTQQALKSAEGNKKFMEDINNLLTKII